MSHLCGSMTSQFCGLLTLEASEALAAQWGGHHQQQSEGCTKNKDKLKGSQDLIKEQLFKIVCRDREKFTFLI